MVAVAAGGLLWCSFGPLDLLALKRYRAMDIEEIKAKVRALTKLILSAEQMI